MAEAALIGLDWGTTSFRAFLFDAGGAILDRRESADGIMSVKDGAFEPVLDRMLAGLEPAPGALPIIAAGMITSRQGWVEAPYVACPADPAAFAAAAITHETKAGRRILFVPGASCRHDGAPDVMRGEEVQILGVAPEGRVAVVLPGTHSKWALVEGGTIAGFATYMTGEVFAALKAHTILGRLMEGEGHDEAAFRQGVERGAADRGAGLTAKLFATRALGLFGELANEASASYLSGLLIGAEFGAALPAHRGDAVLLVGSAGLVARYRAAADTLGVAVGEAAPDAAARGLLAIARARGLSPEKSA